METCHGGTRQNRAGLRKYTPNLISTFVDRKKSLLTKKTMCFRIKAHPRVQKKNRPQSGFFVEKIKCDIGRL